MADTELTDRDHILLLTSVGAYAHSSLLWRGEGARLREQLDAIRNELGCINDADILPTIREYQANEETHNDCLHALRQELGLGDDCDEDDVVGAVQKSSHGLSMLLNAVGTTDDHLYRAENLIREWRNRCQGGDVTDG